MPPPPADIKFMTTYQSVDVEGGVAQQEDITRGLQQQANDDGEFQLLYDNNYEEANYEGGDDEEVRQTVNLGELEAEVHALH